MPLDKQSGVNAMLVAQPSKHGSTASAICFSVFLDLLNLQSSWMHVEAVPAAELLSMEKFGERTKNSNMCGIGGVCS